MRKLLPGMMIVGLIACQLVSAQQKVFAFFEYDLKDGMADRFVEGYAKDLEWHASQEDDWSWAGWFVTTGERRGRFIDATPNHVWRDFDQWKVNSAENARHNAIHWSSYVENASGSYRTVLDEHSNADESWFKRKYLQVYRFEVRPGQGIAFARLLKAFKSSAREKLKDLPFVWMQTVSGGDLHEYLLLVGMETLEGLDACAGLFDFSGGLSADYSDSVRHASSELWSYSERLSLNPDQ